MSLQHTTIHCKVQLVLNQSLRFNWYLIICTANSKGSYYMLCGPHRKECHAFLGGWTVVIAGQELWTLSRWIFWKRETKTERDLKLEIRYKTVNPRITKVELNSSSKTRELWGQRVWHVFRSCFHSRSVGNVRSGKVKPISLWSKEPPPLGGVSLLGGFQTLNPEEEDPPWRTTPKLFSFRSCSSGGSSASGFLVWNQPTKKTPRGGRFLSINLGWHFRMSFQSSSSKLERLFCHVSGKERFELWVLSLWKCYRKWDGLSRYLHKKDMSFVNQVVNTDPATGFSTSSLAGAPKLCNSDDASIWDPHCEVMLSGRTSHTRVESFGFFVPYWICRVDMAI